MRLKKNLPPISIEWVDFLFHICPPKARGSIDNNGRVYVWYGETHRSNAETVGFIVMNRNFSNTKSELQFYIKVSNLNQDKLEFISRLENLINIGI